MGAKNGPVGRNGLNFATAVYSKLKQRFDSLQTDLAQLVGQLLSHRSVQSWALVVISIFCITKKCYFLHALVSEFYWGLVILIGLATEIGYSKFLIGRLVWEYLLNYTWRPQTQ